MHMFNVVDGWVVLMDMFIHECLCGGGEWGCVRQYVGEQYFSVHMCVCVCVCVEGGRLWWWCVCASGVV